MSRDDAFCYSYNIFRLCDRHHKRLDPYLLWDNILGMMGEYDPGPAHDSVETLSPAMRIVIFTVDYHLHLEDQEKLNQMMTEAYAYLSEKQAEALPRNMPVYISVIDDIMATYPENRERYDEAYWISDSFHSLMELPGHAEDWERVKTAMLYAAEQAENKAA